MNDLSELTKSVKKRLGGSGSYQLTEWLVKIVIDEYRDMIEKDAGWEWTKDGCWGREYCLDPITESPIADTEYLPTNKK